MTPQLITLAESMAIAVLRKDWAAALALADNLIELRDNPTAMTKRAEEIYNSSSRPVDGYEVFHWPEFRAFARRLGIVWDLHTREITFTLREGEAVVIKQDYLGMEARNPNPDTTTLHNQQLRTSLPPREEQTDEG